MRRDWLMEMLEERGMSEEEFCVRCGFKWPFFYEIKKARHQNDMKYSVMEKLAKGLDIPVTEVFEAEDKWKKEIKAAAEGA